MNGPTIAPIGIDGPLTPLDSTTPGNPTLSQVINQVESWQATVVPEPPQGPTKFLEFPEEVIRNILWIVDANSFASLCLLNRQWNKVAQDVDLYAYHLSRCPSYAHTNTVITRTEPHDLFKFKSLFAEEVRRNLFDAYARPRQTLIKLISISANSSAAFPGGEAFRFEFSPNCRTILALSSSRIYVLDATSDSLTVKRELKTLRRPLSASTTDDGSLLAVLSSKFQANIYGLPPDGKIKHLQVIVLENSPKTIAIAHEGTVLAAAYETGVEVFSLAANALSTDRRAVRSEAVDILSFSGDGSMLVGSSLSLDDPNAVVISAPFYSENDPDLTPREMHSRMWTTQILFPQISSVCSHVALLPGHIEGDATWLFAYDHSLLSYRAVRTDDTRSGIAYFLGPPTASRFSMPSPTIAPTASMCGTLAVAGFGGSGLCLYGIPERLDTGPDMAAVVERHERKLQVSGPITSATGHMEPLMAYSPSVSGISESIEDDTIASKVDWRQSLFVKCKSIYSLHGHTAAKWVERPDEGAAGFPGKRLLVVAPGGVGSSGGEFGEEPVPLDGSRLCFLDFDYAPSIGQDREITIEVGDKEAELLVEHIGSIATEVAMERRRTVRGMPGQNTRALLARSITAITPMPGAGEKDGRRHSVSQPSSPVEETLNRRSSNASSLQRSASVAGYRHALYPPRPPLGSQQYMSVGVGPGGRPGSVDSWESPPPPYPDAARINAPGQQPGVSQQIQAPQSLPLVNHAANDQNVPAANSQGYLPYRVMHPRASTGMDGMPNTEAAPTRRSMSQYGALSRPARFREPSMSNLDAVAEAPINRNAVKSMDLSSSSSAIDSPGQFGDLQFQRPRPFTQYDAGTGGSSMPNRAPSDAISPLSPSEESAFHRNISINPDQLSRISLTGANLQNRLNLPVPPVPEESPPVPDVPENPDNIATQTTFQAVTAAPAPQLHVTTPPSLQPARPSDQANSPNPRINQSTVVRKPVPGPIGIGAPIPSATNAPASPRGPWMNPEPPGSPSFAPPRQMPDTAVLIHDNVTNLHMNHNFPNVNDGINDQHYPPPSQPYLHRNNVASTSTPNLIRPTYARLDHIDDTATPNPSSSGPGIAFNIGRRMSRAQSMIQAPLHRDRRRPAREQSAYTETTRMTPGFGLGVGGRKTKKKDKLAREDSDIGSKKKGSKCVVM